MRQLKSLRLVCDCLSLSVCLSVSLPVCIVPHTFVG